MPAARMVSAVCPRCGHGESTVVDTRLTEEGWRRRRRSCLSCEARWSTLEVPVDVVDRARVSQRVVARAITTLTQLRSSLKGTGYDLPIAEDALADPVFEPHVLAAIGRGVCARLACDDSCRVVGGRRCDLVMGEVLQLLLLRRDD